MSQKLQVSIYKIAEGETIETLCEKAIGRKFSEQTLAVTSKDGFDLKLYYQVKPSDPKWKGFAEAVAASGADILQQKKSWMEGFVLFLSKDDKSYAVTGGHGHFVIQDCIDADFGIDIFSRLIKKEDKILKSTREKSLVGGVLGTTKYFRKNFNLFENDSFGKIYQELKASIDKDILISKLGFTKEDIEKDSLCVAKSSFRINKDVSFDQLLTLIDGCEAILAAEPSVLINSVEKISKKKDRLLIESLNADLLKQLWDRYSQLDEAVDFDICGDELEKYLTASYYVVSRGSRDRNLFGDAEFKDLSNADILFDALRDLNKKPKDQAAFDKLVRNLKILSYDDAGILLTRGCFLDHLLGDVPYGGKRYFYIDKTWYLIKDTFVDGLNEHCNSFISKHSINMDKTWAATLKDENAYNRQYLGEVNTIVLDKITPENIEPCDVMRWDDDNLYLYHVKSGFGNTMRDLCAQITIATNRIQQDIVADKTFVRKIYQALKNKIGGDEYFDAAGRQTEKISEDDFTNLFDKNITYVLAVLDNATTQRDITKMELFKSNIAKFALQELSKDMRVLDANLRVAQIRRPVILGN
tara:strand:- start:300 stop:2051 length:1752 start_codon:yes stop_codon:yes gene_type:complete